jgi:hypothetical protein
MQFCQKSLAWVFDILCDGNRFKKSEKIATHGPHILGKVLKKFMLISVLVVLKKANLSGIT